MLPHRCYISASAFLLMITLPVRVFMNILAFYEVCLLDNIFMNYLEKDDMNDEIVK